MMPSLGRMSWVDVCRLCMRQGLQTQKIYCDLPQDAAVPMTTRIKVVTELEMSDGDGLPDLICQPCVEQLNTSYEFKRQCLLSDKTLRKYMSQKSNSTIINTNNHLTPDLTPCTSEASQGEVSPTNSEPRSQVSQAETSTECAVKIKQELIICEKVETVYCEPNAVDETATRTRAANNGEDRPMVLIPNFNSSRLREDDSISILPLQCGYCDKAFLKKNMLVMHIKTHMTGRKDSSSKDFKCTLCDKILSCQSLFDRHMRIHTGEKIYKCTMCHQAVSTRGSLNVHMKKHFGGERFSCNVCDKTFSVRGSLNTHLRIHTQDKPYACPVEGCGRSFCVQRDLVRHLKSHTGEKDYECDICNKQLSRRDCLISHLRIHQGIKPFVCMICNKSYRTQSNLTKHLKKHTGGTLYMCKECNTSFEQHILLKEHMRTAHAGKKPFKCPMCVKSFAKQTSLTEHFTKHKEKDFPFKCDKCVRVFPQQLNLTRHLRIHTEEGL